MATAFAGKGGAIFIPGTPSTFIGSIHTYNLQIDNENYDSTALGDQWKTFVIGLHGWQGTMTGFYNVPGDVGGQFLIQNAIITSTSLVVQFEVPIGTSGVGNVPTAMYEGTVNLTQQTIGVPVNNVVSFAATFVGTGSLQYIP